MSILPLLHNAFRIRNALFVVGQRVLVNQKDQFRITCKDSDVCCEEHISVQQNAHHVISDVNWDVLSLKFAIFEIIQLKGKFFSSKQKDVKFHTSIRCVVSVLIDSGDFDKSASSSGK